jgi:hypothetical protein
VYILTVLLGGNFAIFGTFSFPFIAGLAFLIDKATNASLLISAMIIKPK